MHDVQAPYVLVKKTQAGDDYVVLHEAGTHGITPNIAFATHMSIAEAWLVQHILHAGLFGTEYTIIRDMVAYCAED